MNKELIRQRLSALRACMKREQVDAVLVPTDDYHASEYVGEYFKERCFITGFTGSAGVALIMQDAAGLWTDGRYFLQAELELADTGITLFRSGEAGVPSLENYLKQQLPKGGCLAFDGRTITASFFEKLKQQLFEKKILYRQDLDLIGEIWKERPAMSAEPVYELAPVWTGMSRNEKLSLVRRKMLEKKADYFLLTSLDDIAWMTNLRGGDIHCCPLFLSYFVINQQKAWLFVNPTILSSQIRNGLLSDGINVCPYNEVYSFTASIPSGSSVLLSKAVINTRLMQSLPESVSILDEDNPTQLLKAVKNETEAENMRQAHIRDGVAVTRFIYWLKQQVGRERITELSAADKLYELRAMQPHFLGNSFDPIIAYGPHGARPHYFPTSLTDVELEPRSLLVADTGGHYYEGTTDITRTIALGPVTMEEKKYFTAVLRGHLALASAVFKKGCSGMALDILARQPLWALGADYNHGTGHGVGYLLNVHEGPQRIHFNPSGRKPPAPILSGMITSDEPGYYLEGKFGIRHENLLLCRPAMNTGDGEFLCFEPLTMAPFDLDAVLPEQMTQHEIELLNAYHRTVCEKLTPLLPEEESQWLNSLFL